MTRTLNKLTARQVASLKEPGRHSDGGNLYLAISPTGSKTWNFLFRWHGKSIELGFGSARDVSLAQARALATEARQKIAFGENPKQMRQAATDATFKAVSERLIESMRPSWRSPDGRHSAQWAESLFTDAKALAHLPADKITTADVLAVLKQHWQAKPESAARLRGRIERVLDFAKAEGLRSEDAANPARWRGHLDQLLPKRRAIDRGHYAAMAYAGVPAFIQRLREREAVTSAAMEFTILTAARTSGTTGARWSEIDLEKGIWTIPATRMKGGREHRVPLSPQALAILAAMQTIREGDYVFPGDRHGQPLSSSALKMLLRRLPVEDATVHGFRSTFRDWAADCTSFADAVCEMALAHAIANKAEAAYRRGDLFEKRRQLMDAWASFCEGLPGRPSPSRVGPKTA